MRAYSNFYTLYSLYCIDLATNRCCLLSNEHRPYDQLTFGTRPATFTLVVVRLATHETVTGTVKQKNKHTIQGHVALIRAALLSCCCRCWPLLLYTRSLPQKPTAPIVAICPTERSRQTNFVVLVRRTNTPFMQCSETARVVRIGRLGAGRLGFDWSRCSRWLVKSSALFTCCARCARVCVACATMQRLTL